MGVDSVGEDLEKIESVGVVEIDDHPPVASRVDVIDEASFLNSQLSSHTHTTMQAPRHHGAVGLLTISEDFRTLVRSRPTKRAETASVHRGSDRGKRGEWRCDPLLILLLLLLTATSFAQERTARIAAASDLRVALEAVAARFRADGGTSVSLVFGSSGVLARQIVDGAPFDLFLSADEAYVFQVADAGRTPDRGVLYAVGRLALFAPHGSPLVVDAQFDGLRRLLDTGRPLRFAIANPAHAPYGRAAAAALRTAGLWTRIQPALVLGENVSQAAQFAASGNAVGGLVAHSLVVAPPLREQGTFVLVPASAHPPLRQRMVLMKGASPSAVRFYRYLQEPAARALLEQYGFSLPPSP
jgi:molybdate transport system substrate-binding protein